MSRRQAEAHFDGLDIDYDEVFAAQAQRSDAEELADAYALLDDFDAELEATGLAALVRVPRFLDSRRAGRSRRRADRTALRSLPNRLDVTDLIEGDAA
ncbi:hypothetical protein LWP59_02645 [Amycolatopsis acidiphila]|uniref:Uncharacterized protein n=1 Tax=Amycolatopsis acidiphila TaxID=715473 RepID=A0A558A3Q7_9PSEU|nr:hypothetical protein [Amycolatopsis acidiphila]TVT18904.1 hypothetical protein FNH06_26085 [Amycolatopsis acidiphila]UIJ60602.1 hypothetical protein LWP59_02645 [Amycolatopsis acidiphila]GHG81849.1 hypothetical protein GCM10017788_51950 [Amycolatopsis acidiphila]